MAQKLKQKGNRWLFKEEPDHYSLADLERDGTTVWDGVRNNLARQNLWKVRPGDRVLFYHTGTEKAIAGEMTVIGEPYVQADSEDPKAVVVQVRFGRRWPRPVTLARIKQEAALAEWDLVRISRLSIVPVTADQWRQVEQMSQNEQAAEK